MQTPKFKQYLLFSVFYPTAVEGHSDSQVLKYNPHILLAIIRTSRIGSRFRVKRNRLYEDVQNYVGLLYLSELLSGFQTFSCSH
jgi:hypothetical protein